MPYQERKTIVSLISTFILFVLYGILVWQRFRSGSIAAENEFRFWSLALIVMIPFQMIPRIFIEIIFNIHYRITTREEEPAKADEFDKLINLKATRNFYHLFMIGFIASLATQAFGLPPRVMFLSFFATMVIAGLFGELWEFIYYRRGV